MNTQRILEELRAERAHLDRAITAVEAITSKGAGRSTTTKTPGKNRTRPRMSAAARKRISVARKQWWAEKKKKKKKKKKKSAQQATAKRAAASSAAAKNSGHQ
jgi:hypothetical protein